MKPFYTLCLLVIGYSTAWAQGTITGFTVHPPTPTSLDNITIYANVQFNYGDCPLDYALHNVSGSTIHATAHHCIGLLTVVCPTTDTFELGQLPPGNYNFDLTLTSGSGGPGCTPGFAPDDTESFQFSVTTAVGVHAPAQPTGWLYPNPTNERLYFQIPLDQSAVLLNTQGQQLQELAAGTASITLSHLPPGVYFLRYKQRHYKLLKH